MKQIKLERMEADYIRNITEEFRRRLDKGQHTPRHEEDIQKYLERHPVLLPGLTDRHHGPAGNVVVAKPDLGDFVPDFAFVSKTTADYQFTLVEIEDPCKPVFTNHDAFTKSFREAHQQVKDWVGAWDRLKDRLMQIFSDVLPSEPSWKYKTKL